MFAWIPQALLKAKQILQLLTYVGLIFSSLRGAWRFIKQWFKERKKRWKEKREQKSKSDSPAS